MAIYMKFGDIKGSVTTDGFKDWIELGKFQWGVGRSVNSSSKGKVETFVEYQLKEVGLSGYSAGAGADDAPQESLSLNFSAVTWKYIGRDSKIAGTPEVVGWDLAQQKKI